MENLHRSNKVNLNWEIPSSHPTLRDLIPKTDMEGTTPNEQQKSRAKSTPACTVVPNTQLHFVCVLNMTKVAWSSGLEVLPEGLSVNILFVFKIATPLYLVVHSHFVGLGSWQMDATQCWHTCMYLQWVSFPSWTREHTGQIVFLTLTPLIWPLSVRSPHWPACETGRHWEAKTGRLWFKCEGHMSHDLIVWLQQ